MINFRIDDFENLELKLQKEDALDQSDVGNKVYSL